MQAMRPSPDQGAVERDVGPVRTILVGADGSDGAHRAVAWAAEVARPTGARVVAVHVLTPNRELLRDFSFETMRTWRRELEHQLRGEWVEPLRTHHVENQGLVVEADSVAAGILAAATQRHADLIVLGARGRSARALTSTSHLLTHRASCPVVVVPPAWQPRAAT